MVKVCEKCGYKFECLHNKNCWCNNLKITKELGLYLKETYKDCLCKKCLSEFVEKYKNNLQNK